MAGPYWRRHRQGLEQMSDKPTMLAWAMKDLVFPPDFIDAYWKRSLPDAVVLGVAPAAFFAPKSL